MFKNGKEKSEEALFFLSVNTDWASTWQISPFPEPFRCGLPQNYFDRKRLDGSPVPATRHSPWAKTSRQSGCRWPWLLRDARSTWHTRGIRKLDGWPTGIWKPREGITSCPGLCVWFSETSKQVLVPRSQARRGSAPVFSARSLSAAGAGPGFASAQSHQDSVPPKSPFEQ